MGRRRSRRTIEDSAKVYEILLDSDGWVPTPQLFMIVMKKGILDEYARLYQLLKFLKTKGLIVQENRGGKSYWTAAKAVDQDELYRILSS